MVNLILLFDIIGLVTIKNVCYLLFVDFKERNPDLAVLGQIFSFVELCVDVIHDTLDYAFVSILRHHVPCRLRHC